MKWFNKKKNNEKEDIDKYNEEIMKYNKDVQEYNDMIEFEEENK